MAHGAPKEDADEDPQPHCIVAAQPRMSREGGEIPTPQPSPAGEPLGALVCHFCQKTRSDWTRRERLVVLRRRRQ